MESDFKRKSELQVYFQKIHTLAHAHTYTHTWARVEAELRRSLQGVDEWGLAKLPGGVQISSIYKQHSCPWGGEGGMVGVRQKESYNSWSGRKKGEKNELRDRLMGEICEV